MFLSFSFPLKTNQYSYRMMTANMTIAQGVEYMKDALLHSTSKDAGSGGELIGIDIVSLHCL